MTYVTIASPTIVRYKGKDYYVTSIDPQRFTATLVRVNDRRFVEVVAAEDFDTLEVVEHPVTLSAEIKPTP